VHYRLLAHGSVNTTNRYRAVLLAAVALACAARASRKVDVAQASISTQARFSRTFQGAGDTVCWGVKRALLSQGYMLDRPGESGCSRARGISSLIRN
jgi:hypothetical protein